MEALWKLSVCVSARVTAARQDIFACYDRAPHGRRRKKNDSGPYNKRTSFTLYTLRGFRLVGSLRDYNEQFREESTDTEKPHRRDEDEAMWLFILGGYQLKPVKPPWRTHLGHAIATQLLRRERWTRPPPKIRRTCDPCGCRMQYVPRKHYQETPVYDNHCVRETRLSTLSTQSMATRWNARWAHTVK